MNEASSPKAGRFVAALAASAAGLGLTGIAMSNGRADWPMAVVGLFAATVGLASTFAAFSRSRAGASLGRLVLRRGATWAILVPKLYVIGRNARYGGFGPGTHVVLAAVAIVSLVASHVFEPDERASLSTDFRPLAHRRWLLAGTTASIAASILLAHLALGAARHGAVGAVAGYGSAAAAYALAAAGVLRMRTWGVVLGAVASLALLGYAVTSGGAHWLQCGTAITSTLVLAAPLIASRMR